MHNKKTADRRAKNTGTKNTDTKDTGTKNTDTKDTGTKDTDTKDTDTKDTGTKDTGTKETAAKDRGTTFVDATLFLACITAALYVCGYSRNIAYLRELSIPATFLPKNEVLIFQGFETIKEAAFKYWALTLSSVYVFIVVWFLPSSRVSEFLKLSRFTSRTRFLILSSPLLALGIKVSSIAVTQLAVLLPLGILGLSCYYYHSDRDARIQWLTQHVITWAVMCVFLFYLLPRYAEKFGKALADRTNRTIVLIDFQYAEQSSISVQKPDCGARYLVAYSENAYAYLGEFDGVAIVEKEKLKNVRIWKPQKTPSQPFKKV